MDDLDYVLIMTSEPDGRDQQLNPRMLEKIRFARNRLPERIAIMADGGIGADSLAEGGSRRRGFADPGTGCVVRKRPG